MDVKLVAEGLDGGDDPGHQLAPGDIREIPGHRPEGQAAAVLIVGIDGLLTLN